MAFGLVFDGQILHPLLDLRGHVVLLADRCLSAKASEALQVTQLTMPHFWH
jgi:hypothetical protein